MRRRPVVVAPRRGPGLVGTVARTAVIAGTATAVSKGVSNSMNNSAQQKAAAQQAQADQAAAAQQAQIDAAVAQQLAAQQAAAAPPAAPATPAPAAPAPAPAAPTADDTMTQLQKLMDMKTAGMLTDEEFAAAKAKVLAG